MNERENGRSDSRLPEASDRFTDAILDGGVRIRRYERRRRAASRLAAAAAALAVLAVGLALLARGQRAPHPDHVLRAVDPDSLATQTVGIPMARPTASPDPNATPEASAAERFLQVIADDGAREPSSTALFYELADPASRKVVIPGGTLVERLGAARGDMVWVRYASAEGYMRKDNLVCLREMVRLYAAEEGATLYAGPEAGARMLTRLEGGVPVECGAASTAVEGRAHVSYGGLEGWAALDELRLLPAGAALGGATLVWPGGTGEPLEQRLSASRLEALAELLRGARPGAAGDCPYGGQLVVLTDGGDSLRLARPLDGCGALIADNGMVFTLEPGSEAAFWTLFDEAAENLRLQREG